MKRSNVFFLLSMLSMGCGSAGETKATVEPAAPASSAAPARARSNTKESTREEQSMLEEGQVRVPLIVLPGDAPVEVDGVIVRRRHGAVELIGKVGEEKHVRVLAGTSSNQEMTVKIEAMGTSPAVIQGRPISK